MLTPDFSYVSEALRRQKDLYIHQGDKILFVVDRRDRVLDSVFDSTFDVCFIPEVTRPGMDYQIDPALLEGKTVAWLITSQSITHSTQTRELMKREMYVISNPNIQPDWVPLLAEPNRSACIRNANRVLNAIGGDVSAEIRITADDGTDLTLSVPAINWKPETGERTGRRTNGVFGELINVPYRAKGVYVLNNDDFVTNPINRVGNAQRGIKIWIEENRVVSISGQGEGRLLWQILNSANDPLAFHLGEFAFGINPAMPDKVLCSTVAEKLMGGVHIAAGTPMSVSPLSPDIDKFKHGTGYSAGVHMDMIKYGASVTINEVPILKNGFWLLK